MGSKAAGKVRAWTMGTLVVCLIILVAVWFLVASPLWSSASEANSAASDQESQNDTQRDQVARLKAQFEKMDQYEALLTDLRVQVPTTLEHAEFQRQFAALADEHGVTVSNLSFSDSTKVDLTVEQAAQLGKPLASVAVPDPSTPSSDADSTSSGGSSSSQAGDQTATGTADSGSALKFSNFYLVPVTMEVRGAYSDVLALVKSVQSSSKRIMLITSLKGEGMTASEAEDGQTAVKDGDLSLTISGTLSVLVDPQAKTAMDKDDDTVTAPDLPTPSEGDNPLTTSK